MARSQISKNSLLMYKKWNLVCLNTYWKRVAFEARKANHNYLLILAT